MPSPKGPKASRGTLCILQESKTAVAAVQTSTPAEPQVVAASWLSRPPSTPGLGEKLVSGHVSCLRSAFRFLSPAKPSL